MNSTGWLRIFEKVFLSLEYLHFLHIFRKKRNKSRDFRVTHQSPTNNRWSLFSHMVSFEASIFCFLGLDVIFVTDVRTPCVKITTTYSAGAWCVKKNRSILQKTWAKKNVFNPLTCTFVLASVFDAKITAIKKNRYAMDDQFSSFLTCDLLQNFWQDS